MLARAIDIRIDDADSLPLIAAAANAIEKMVRAAGIAPRDARLVRERVPDIAEKEYRAYAASRTRRGIPRKARRGSGSCWSPRTGVDEAVPREAVPSLLFNF